MSIVVWTYDSFENNLGINCKVEYYLKESYQLRSDQHFSFKYFLKAAFVKYLSSE